jgi:5-methylcytosine-specific restriction endonuclease McrA
MPKKTPPFENYPLWTEARFWTFIRSALRRASDRYPPKQEAKKLNRRVYKGQNKKQKWEYQCKKCDGWFMEKEVEIDHIIPTGTLRSFEDLADFCRRLFCGVEGYQIMCKKCHAIKTNDERSK